MHDVSSTCSICVKGSSLKENPSNENFRRYLEYSRNLYGFHSKTYSDDSSFKLVDLTCETHSHRIYVIGSLLYSNYCSFLQ